VTAAPEGSANHCYRHPDRESYVLCQRCGRTICPECMTQAPVGVICPECMREARASMPRTKPALLRRSDDRPVVTLGIIAVTVLVYLLQWVPSLAVPQNLAYTPILTVVEPWRMLTTVFVHSRGFIFHILLNMYMLWIFGQLMEQLLGRVRFLALYLISGFAGSVGVLLLAPVNTVVVGASGAVFGLMAAFLVIQRRLGGNTNQLLILLVINLVIGFIPGLNIAWQAHVGGLVGGALVGLIYLETRRPRQKALQVTLIVVLVGVLVAASVARIVL
jgi:membrane associated rhomboid family serine protease